MRSLEIEAIKHNITTIAIRDLLSILISFGFVFLPKDPRTLLKTPKKIHIVHKANGQMWYSGIKSNLCKIFRTLNKNITLDLNFHFDGVQIYKSAIKSFWPILAQSHDELANVIAFIKTLLKRLANYNYIKYIFIGFPNIKPFVVGIWYGNGKPSCVNEYLASFVDELNHLMENGIEINGFILRISTRCILGDTPARCFLKGSLKTKVGRSFIYIYLNSISRSRYKKL